MVNDSPEAMCEPLTSMGPVIKGVPSMNASNQPDRTQTEFLTYRVRIDLVTN